VGAAGRTGGRCGIPKAGRGGSAGKGCRGPLANGVPGPDVGALELWPPPVAGRGLACGRGLAGIAMFLFSGPGAGLPPGVAGGCEAAPPMGGRNGLNLKAGRSGSAGFPGTASPPGVEPAALAASEWDTTGSRCAGVPGTEGAAVAAGVAGCTSGRRTDGVG
jgi:hypothetical protein